MIIGLDAKRAFKNQSGLGNYSRFIISSLVRLFPENWYLLFTTGIKPLFKDFYPSGAGETHIITPDKKIPGWAAWWRSFGLPKELKQKKVQLYHGLSNELPFGIKRSGIKSVVTIHDLIFLRFPELYPLPDRLIYRLKFSYACRVADHIVAISEQTKQDIINYFGTDASKISVIYQDCDPVFHQQLPASRLTEIKNQYNLPAQYVLCVGTLEPRKNQLTLLKAWYQSEASKTYHLVLVGKSTGYKAQLDAYIAEHNLHTQVHFMPYIPFSDLPGIYQQASLFVYPSLFEGFGIPILEALNSGVPVISTEGSCFAEAGGPYSQYVPAQNTNALQQKIDEVLFNPILQQQMQSQGLLHALGFRAEVTIPQLHALYQQLV